MKSLFLLFPGIFLFFIPLHSLAGDVLLDPPSMELSPDDFPEKNFSVEFRIENRDEQPLGISFLTNGESWSVDPPELDIRPGGTATVRVAGPLPEENPVTLLLLSDRDDAPSLYFIRKKGPAVLPVENGVGADGPVSLFFFTPGCLICEKFYNDLIPELTDSFRLSPVPEKRNIYDPGNFELMRRLLSERDSIGNDFPVLIMGDRVFRGERALFQDFPAFLADGSTSSTPSAKTGTVPTVPAALSELHLLPVFFAGLLDGINPCAFTTLIFLISYLRLLGKKGKDILSIGSSFSLGVFVTYFMIGLGFFQAVRMAQSFFLISQVIRWSMVFLLLVLSGMSFYDYGKVRQGRAGESLLQLSKGTKKRIHTVIRTSSRAPFFVFGSFGAGAVISLYELGCTGQIYLPMVVYMVKQDTNWFTLFPLVLYNAGFILPLILVFILFYRGSDSEKIARAFERRLGAVKMATALLFLAVAGILILLG